MSSNQIAPRSQAEPDLLSCMAYAQASFVLVESLMLALVEHGVLTRSAITEVIDLAAESARCDSADAVHDNMKVLIGKIVNSVSAADCPSSRSESASSDRQPTAART